MDTSRIPRHRGVVAFAFVLALVGAALASRARTADASPVGPTTRIVNGTLTPDFPAVGAFLVGDFVTGVGDGRQAATGCTATLIGCKTAITAAHCVCGIDFTTGGCVAGENPPEARLFGVFFANAGFYNAVSVAVDPSYDFNASIGDMAIVHLAGPVTGIHPATLTDRVTVTGEAATIVGYGRTSDDVQDSGVKRLGSVTLTDCNDGTNGEVICWSFDGSGNNTCIGDSGGPLFVSSAPGQVLAGITSAGSGCVPVPPTTSVRTWDSGVFTELGWISQEAGLDLGGAHCGGEPEVGDPEVEVFTTTSFIDEQNRWATQSFVVPSGSSRVRIATMTSANLRMLARPGRPLTGGSDESPCFVLGVGKSKMCSFDNPQPGPWYVGEEQEAGHGDVQLTVTILNDGLGPTTTTTTSSTTTSTVPTTTSTVMATTSTVTSTSTTSTTVPVVSRCSQPVTDGPTPKASDCLFILEDAVGSVSCVPACVCAPAGGLPVTSTDALMCLRKAVGISSVVLDCRC